MPSPPVTWRLPGLERMAFRAFLAAAFLAGRCRRRSPENNRLIIFKPDGIGDLVLAAGAIRFLSRWAREKHGLAPHLIVAEFCRDFAEREFPDCTVHSVPFCGDGFREGAPRTVRAFLRQLPGLSTSLLVSLRHQPTMVQDFMLASISADRSFELRGCPLPHVTRWRKFRPSFAGRYPGPAPSIPRELSAHASLLEAVTGEAVPPDAIHPRLLAFPTREDGTLVVFPFAGSPVRELADETLFEVLQGAKPLFRQILLCAPPASRERAIEIQTRLAARSVTVEISLPATICGAAELIASATAVFAMESGPAHLATALDKRGVFVLGGGHHGYFAPWKNSPRQVWVDHPLPCYLCNWNCCFPEPRCIRDIPSNDFIRAVESTLTS